MDVDVNVDEKIKVDKNVKIDDKIQIVKMSKLTNLSTFIKTSTSPIHHPMVNFSTSGLLDQKEILRNGKNTKEE